MSNTYTELTYTNFPDKEDTFNRFSDLTVDDLEYANQYQLYYNLGELDTASKILSEHPELENKVINAYNLNRLIDAIKAMERFYLYEISTAMNRAISETHNHNNLYYTETEIDSKVTAINNTIDNTRNTINNTIDTLNTQLNELKISGIPSHTHAVSDINGVNVDATHINYLSNVSSDIQTQINNRVTTGALTSSISDLQTQLNNKSNTNHTHDYAPSIYVSSTDLTSGSTSLSNGKLAVVYE